MQYPAIDNLYIAWSDAFRRQDVDAILAPLTPDYVLWAPGAADITANELRARCNRIPAAHLSPAASEYF
jgi:ketosteroid isomerase-like protein